MDAMTSNPGADSQRILLPMESAEDAEEDVCVICFEPGSFVSLPCNCQLKYCMPCWDRALATGVMLRGKPQCPSCRQVFHVDFDPIKGELVCSPCPPDASASSSSDIRSRIYAKARPTQIKHLRTYGQAVASWTKSSSSTDSAAAPSSEEADEVECSGGEASPHPMCVCGSELECITPRSRILRMLEEHDPNWRSHVREADCIIKKLVDSALVTCDLCEKDATRSGNVWTCKRGQHTLLHPAAYDVCEKCFLKFAGTSPQLQPERHDHPGCGTSMLHLAPTWKWLQTSTVGHWLGVCSTPQTEH
mmetsp:Transcript_93608/g.241877  ORF Transcript_93608/g.241877 Transcript_93608/m.241877 type:complete len:304 (-) Transcript_93608:222-1133(-)